MSNHIFSARLLCPGTWCIAGAGCDCYLLEGAREAIMIDAGQTTADIRAFAQGLTPQPLRRVINTHSHFDHTGGNGWFDEALMGRDAMASAKTVMDDMAWKYRLDYPITPVEDGQEIDLGGRVLRVLVLGCHAPGSLVVLDESQGLLFCGDEVDTGQVLLLPGYATQKGQVHGAPASTVQACRNAMARLWALQSSFSHICPAHNGAPASKQYIAWLAALCDEVLAGKAGAEDCSSPSYSPGATHYPYPDAGYLRAAHKGVALVYNRHLLWEKDTANAAALPPATPLHVMCAAGVWQGWE